MSSSWAVCVEAERLTVAVTLEHLMNRNMEGYEGREALRNRNSLIVSQGTSCTSSAHFCNFLSVRNTALTIESIDIPAKHAAAL